MDWQQVNCSIRRAYFKPWRDIESLDHWVIAAKVNGDLFLTAYELARFHADVHSRDCAYVDELDFEVDLANDFEWRRV